MQRAFSNMTDNELQHIVDDFHAHKGLQGGYTNYRAALDEKQRRLGRPITQNELAGTYDHYRGSGYIPGQ